MCLWLSLILKATATPCISSFMASCHTMLLFIQSNSKAWHVFQGTRMLSLVEVNWTSLCIPKMIWSLFVSVYGTHHAKAISLLSILALAYSATSTETASIISTSWIQEVDQSSHSILRSYPLVVFQQYRLPSLLVMKALFFGMASALWWWPTICLTAL